MTKLKFYEKSHKYKNCDRPTGFNRWYPMKDNSILIRLANHQDKVTGLCYIDKEDLKKVYDCRWCLGTQGKYVMNSKYGYLHHRILKPKDGYEIDHIDRDKLNNRKSNLRYVTKQEQQINLSLAKNNTSGVTGVDFIHNKWRARIYRKGKEHNLGLFKIKEDAINERKKTENSFL